MKFPWSKAEEPANPAEPTEADKKHWEEEYEKNRHQQSEPKKPGVFGSIARKAGGAAVGFVEAQRAQRYIDKSTKEEATHTKATQLAAKFAAKQGYDMPTKHFEQLERGISAGTDRESKVRAEARKMGINPHKRVEVRSGFGSVEYKEVNKEIGELELETAQAKQQSQDIKSFQAAELGRRLGTPFRAAGSAAGKTADVMQKFGTSAQLRPTGQRRGGVTPTGIRGGNQLFAPSFRSGGTGPNMQAGMRMHTGSGLGQLRTGMSVPRPQQQTRPQMANRPLPITGRPMSPATRVPSVMPRMNLSAAPRLNYGAGGGLRRPTVPTTTIGRGMGLNINRMRNPGSVPKLRLF